MENIHNIYIVAALAAIITCIFLASSEDWASTLCSLPYLVCTTVILVQVSFALKRRDTDSPIEWRLHMQFAARMEEQQATHRKRERASRSAITALEKTVGSLAEELKAARDAAFDKTTDLFLENNRLKRRLRQVEITEIDASTVMAAHRLQEQFDSVRAMMAEAGINVVSPRDFKRAIENLCQRKPLVVPAADESLVSLTADLTKAHYDLASEKTARADVQRQVTELESKLSQQQQHSQAQQSAGFAEVQRALVQEKQVSQHLRSLLAGAEEWKSSAIKELQTGLGQQTAKDSEIARLNEKLAAERKAGADKQTEHFSRLYQRSEESQGALQQVNELQAKADKLKARVEELETENLELKIELNTR